MNVGLIADTQCSVKLFTKAYFMTGKAGCDTTQQAGAWRVTSGSREHSCHASIVTKPTSSSSQTFSTNQFWCKPSGLWTPHATDAINSNWTCSIFLSNSEKSECIILWRVNSQMATWTKRTVTLLLSASKHDGRIITKTPKIPNWQPKNLKVNNNSDGAGAGAVVAGGAADQVRRGQLPGVPRHAPRLRRHRGVLLVAGPAQHR